MVETAGGVGAAGDATVSVADLQEELRRRIDAERAAAPAVRVTKAAEKVERARRDLAAAEAELAAAQAALEGN